ncbi:MAG TPA: hypothetical protein VKD72_14645 [Gemmataceae bacterium]|nr:hypothetical protein [Gemmataceae bacterium]
MPVLLPSPPGERGASGAATTGTHREILEVTAIIHAGARSLKEMSRLVALSEVMG